jgi:hypothetical protein
MSDLEYSSKKTQ